MRTSLLESLEVDQAQQYTARTGSRVFRDAADEKRRSESDTGSLERMRLVPALVVTILDTSIQVFGNKVYNITLRGRLSLKDPLQLEDIVSFAA